ncbi:hypothetical protein K402DRAFT_310772, partial [Aulographum hederae CBS 113979]
MQSEGQPVSPGLQWRVGSAAVMGMTGILSRSFVQLCSYTEVVGLDRFLKLLDERRDIEGRERGLVTVSNHLSVVDDPAIWGVLPFSYIFNPDHLRWSLGSHDICYANSWSAEFFTFGQTLPTHRLKHSPHGGLFQPTMTQAIRLLSRGPFAHARTNPSPAPSEQVLPASSASPRDLADPFSSAHLTYSTTGLDVHPAPSAYLTRRHAWVHIFPEGMIHQTPDKTMRYFKWGVSRLILESDPCPDVVPIWIEGFDQVMHESRGWPRPFPRLGKKISVTFGEKLDVERVFGDLRRAWKKLYTREEAALLEKSGKGERMEVGELTPTLKYGAEAVELRMACTMRVREEILKLRKARGYGDEDPKQGRVETWLQEGDGREGKKEDGS